MKLPFITCKEHDRIVKNLKQEHGNSESALYETHRTREYTLRTDIRRILDKFATIELSHSRNDYITWRLIFAFDPRPIIFSLEKGRDGVMIEQIAEELKLRIVKQLYLLNVQHPDDLDLER